MTDVTCHRIKLKPGSLPRVREWAREIGARRGEALVTLAEEGVAVESVFLEQSSEGDFLIYYMRADSLARAAATARRSTHDIDRYHQAFKRDTWDGRTKLELLVDLASSGADP